MTDSDILWEIAAITSRHNPDFETTLQGVEKMDKELRQIESLMFGGFLEDTPEDGIAWRVFEEVMALKKERDGLLAAIRNLRDVSGRHHTEQAARALIALLPENSSINPHE